MTVKVVRWQMSHLIFNPAEGPAPGPKQEALTGESDLVNSTVLNHCFRCSTFLHTTMSGILSLTWNFLAVKKSKTHLGAYNGTYTICIT